MRERGSPSLIFGKKNCWLSVRDGSSVNRTRRRTGRQNPWLSIFFQRAESNARINEVPCCLLSIFQSVFGVHQRNEPPEIHLLFSYIIIFLFHFSDTYAFFLLSVNFVVLPYKLCSSTVKKEAIHRPWHSAQGERPYTFCFILSALLHWIIPTAPCSHESTLFSKRHLT